MTTYDVGHLIGQGIGIVCLSGSLAVILYLFAGWRGRARLSSRGSFHGFIRTAGTIAALLVAGTIIVTITQAVAA